MRLGVGLPDMRLAILSDTHVPSRAQEVPEWVEEEVEAADHVVHAGDFDSEAAYEGVESLAAELTAVHGNMDPRDLDLPTTATVELGGVRFVVTHGTGPLENYDDRVVETARENADGRNVVAVAGHTHEVRDDDFDDVRLLNPGSATGADPASRTTMYRATVEDGDVDVELLEE